MDKNFPVKAKYKECDWFIGFRSQTSEGVNKQTDFVDRELINLYFFGRKVLEGMFFLNIKSFVSSARNNVRQSKLF